jgi:hypothetical protein
MRTTQGLNRRGVLTAIGGGIVAAASNGIVGNISARAQMAQFSRPYRIQRPIPETFRPVT